MRAKILLRTIMTLFIILLLNGCDSANSSENRPQNPEPFNQVNNFEVEIFSEDNDISKVQATLTYTGEQSTVEITHNIVPVVFNLYRNGELLFPKELANVQEHTTLSRNEPLKIPYIEDELSNLEAGDYEIEAIAIFSFEDTDYNISVSTSIEITQ